MPRDGPSPRGEAPRDLRPLAREDLKHKKGGYAKPKNWIDSPPPSQDLEEAFQRGGEQESPDAQEEPPV